MFQPVGLPPAGRRSAFDPRWVIVPVAACLVAGSIGFFLGVNRSNLTIHSCAAVVAPTQATATCGDTWAYAIPVDNVQWRDSAGAWHEGGRPDCLPLGPQHVDRITFATVDVSVNGVAWRPVIWIAC